MDFLSLPTPKTDKVLQVFTFRTKEGLVFNDIVTQGQKVIMEIILSRGINSETMAWINRIHVMAHTRYGKSLAIGAAVSVRAATKQEPWAIVSPTKDQSQIIMDYVLHFSINDPILSALLATDAKILKAERLTQRRARDYITYLNGGEVRTFGGKATMGFGCKNVIEDEAGLIGNEEDSKIFRMLGDSTDNFLMKVGNPWNSADPDTGEEHHFYTSFLDPSYYQIDIPIEQGIKEGRVLESFHVEVKKKPNYAILYKNTFPDAQARDKDGYMPMFSHTWIRNMLVEPGTLESIGSVKLGADPADGGENESTIATRSMNLAKVVFRSTTVDCLQFASDVVQHGRGIEDWRVDKQGVGTGTVRRLQESADYYRRLSPINAGLPVPKNIPTKDADDYLNLRAYAFWQYKLWTEGGGKTEKTPGIEKQLLALRFKNNKAGKVVVISKEELHKRGVHDLGLVDPISFTFMPKAAKVQPTSQVVGGTQPYYPDLGF